MTQESTPTLEPCPFCGADGPCFGGGFVGEPYGIVNCADCGGAMQVQPGTEAEAIAAWNRRPPPASQSGVLAEARHEMDIFDRPSKRTSLRLIRRVEELEAENAALLTKMRMIDFLADSIKRRTASKEQAA